MKFLASFSNFPPSLSPCYYLITDLPFQFSPRNKPVQTAFWSHQNGCMTKTKEKSIILWLIISLAQLQVQLELGGGQLQPDHWLSDHLPKVTGLASHHWWLICDHYHHYFYRCFFRDKLCLWCFPFLRNEYLAHAEWFWWFWLIVSRWHSSVVVAWLGESTDKPRHWPEK